MASGVRPIPLTASQSITPDMANADLIMDAAGAALTFTLPAATGTGYTYKFKVGTVNTSNYIIKVANATDTIDGSVDMAQDAADTSVTFEATGTADTITLNGTTTGGANIGDYVELQDIKSGQWSVEGQVTGSGTEATPFSATVA